jgi:hypothetical protein
MFEQDPEGDGMHKHMPRTKTSIVWTRIFASVVLSTVGIGILTAGCVDPKTDFDNWLARTEDAQSNDSPVDAAVARPEGSLPDQKFTQTYAMACVSQILNDDITEATVFTSTVTFTPTATGGIMDFSDQTLMAHATSLSQLVGTPRTVNGSPVNANGMCDVSFGETTFPGTSNVVGQDVDIKDTVLHFMVGPGMQLCATLTGNMLQPVQTTLTASQNICIYLPTTDQIPPLTQDMVHCP